MASSAFLLEEVFGGIDLDATEEEKSEEISQLDAVEFQEDELNCVEPPFADLKLSSYRFLPKSRKKCHSCQKSYLWYCYECFLPLADFHRFPSKLPVHIHMFAVLDFFPVIQIASS